MTLQPAPVMPVDIELLLTNYFDDFLADRAESYAQDVYVDVAKPAQNKPRIVTVRRDGGAVAGLFDNPRVTIRVWANDSDAGGDLARLLVGALKVMPISAPGVVAVPQIFGPSPVPDQSQPQYLVTCELRVRCIEI